MDLTQQPFGTPDGSEFVDNPEPRCPVVLLLDTSTSMHGDKIEALNAGLMHFHEELAADRLAMKRVEVATITFGPVQDETSFVTADAFNPPTLTAGGNTPMGAAVVHGADILKARKAHYRSAGVDFYRPWIFLITDGAPTDNIAAAKARVAEGEAGKEFMFFAVGVDGADMEILTDLSVRAPLMLRGLAFRELFAWLSNSLSAVSRSRTDDAVPLANPTAPDGWATAG
ncbi:MAG: VWA domain-containing protein [Pseudomonadota bacterium]